MSYAAQLEKYSQDNHHSMTSSMPDSNTANESSLTSEHQMESPSDNDASERQTRERLKKANLGSISSVIAGSVEAGESPDQIMSTQDDQLQSLPADIESEEDVRGRLERKRSLDDIITIEDKDALGGGGIDTNIDHTRKRSREVRNGEPHRSEGSRQISPEAALQEAEESGDDKEFTRVSIQNGFNQSTGMDTPPSESEVVDEKMQDSIRSPRKKRSRDLAEIESHREQKIAATDENRARRRSSSEDRKETPEVNDDTVEITAINELNGQVASPGELSSKSPMEEPNIQIPQASGFVNTATESPFTNIAKQTSLNTDSSLNQDNAVQPSKTSPSAFASSGFAALAKSSTSPFGALDSTSGLKSSQLPTGSPFAALSSPQTEKINPSNSGAPSSGFSSAASPFTSSKLPGFGTLGGFGSGSGFGTGFGSGSKLTSFAAPTGDAKLGGRTAKPFGASADSEGEAKDSESGSGNDEEDRSVKGSEADSIFQKQEMDTGEEGEDTIFQVRGKLFEFTSTGEWSERGIGPFKINVRRPELEAAKGDGIIRARFIMRAHLTHRVMLNTRVFKEMKITDSRGNAPSGNRMLFSVHHEGKVIPYLFKTRNEEDIKTLYREVTKLQKEL